MRSDLLVITTLEKICQKVSFGRRCVEETYKEYAFGLATYRDVPDLFAVTGVGLPYTGSGNRIKYHPKDMCVWIKEGDSGLFAVCYKGVWNIATDEQFLKARDDSHASNLTQKIKFKPSEKVLVFQGF